MGKGWERFHPFSFSGEDTRVERPMQLRPGEEDGPQYSRQEHEGELNPVRNGESTPFTRGTPD